ncbi:MAG TPA: ClpXP protease specificity-enhancing factor [Usitatibacteraceae bacterium]|nr:ClpXP protease specificity-enhancing factor [Usitatibacteraceae bacterium]HQY46819.1 ClpXP protease specificity-enhancing factor [Usitatibacteraceae bacterium]
MSEVSTKPYFIRAIYEWCSDCGFTPYLSVKVDERTRVPAEHVKNGEIVLNVSLNATRNLTINNELVQFSARFNGVSREVTIPVDRVQGIFARENGQGAFFTVEPPAACADPAAPAQPTGTDTEPPKPAPAGKTRLKLVK